MPGNLEIKKVGNQISMANYFLSKLRTCSTSIFKKLHYYSANYLRSCSAPKAVNQKSIINLILATVWFKFTPV